jgi:hypothetical protein
LFTIIKEISMLITLQDTPALRLHPDDDVAIALVPLSANRRIEIAGQTLRMAADVAAGHKLALRGIEVGQPLRRYGQVIGFDNIPAAELVSPALTTVTQFQEQLGRRAAQMVLERIDGSAPEGGRCEEMPAELIIRESA